MDPHLLLIPLVSALIGWGTNALAIQMLFQPLQRRGWRWLSWQGVLPSHAERMAKLCVRMMTNRLLDIREAYARVEPKRIAELLGPCLEQHAEVISERVLVERYPRLWEALPERVRNKVRARLRAEVPNVVQALMDEIGEDVERYLDMEDLVVQAFVADRALVNELFWRCGENEFRFIVRCGLLFGGLFGVFQMVVWIFIQPDWFLPLTGLFVGWATNWLALKMVFRPMQERGKGPFRWQGLFHRRQNEVSDAYADFFADRILHPEALVRAIIEGPAAERVVYLLQRSVAQAVDQASGPARRLIQLAVGSTEWRSLKRTVSEGLTEVIPSELDRIYGYTAEALSLKSVMEKEMIALPPEDFEQVLRPIFQEDEGTLIAVGAALGTVAGVLQWALMSAI